jgi:hypothetical protein
MVERKPEWAEASELLTATIDTDTKNCACTKLGELKRGIASYRGEN